MIKKTIQKLVGLAMAVLPLALGAQTQTENHVVSKTYKVSTSTKLTTKNPDSVATAIQYFDGLGRAKQSVLLKGGKAGYVNNNLSYDWSTGTPTNAGFYNLSGDPAENQIITGTTPFGDTDLIWECVNDAASNPDGGWNTDYVNIDHTKAYRYTVWVKRNNHNGRTYHGAGSVDNLDGTPNGNPYFWYGDMPQLDTWYLLVGYIHPSNHTGGDVGISGLYDMQGNKVADGTEFKWQNTVSQSFFRSYFYYSTDTNSRQYFWSPLLQKIDGSEDSINDVLTATTVYNNEELQAKDIVTHYQYDTYGRQLKEYLPYASGYSDGRINTNAGLATQTYYQNNYTDDFTGVTNTADINSFSDKILESSPLGRVFEQTAPGKDWNIGGNISNKDYSDGHTIKMEYLANAANEIRRYYVTTNFTNNTYEPTLQGGTSDYPAGELTKMVTKDENWTTSDGFNKTTEEFKNLQGQVILKRTYNAGVAHDTYYVYDNFGNLTYVLPPKSEASVNKPNNSELDELCYQYVYDYRNRLVEKKIPGKGWEYIVYDKLDRPVLTQDANQRVASPDEWLFTKYDALGRAIHTGLYEDNGTREALQISANNSSVVNEYYAGSGVPGTSYYYTLNAFPTNIPYYNVHTINYYDDYVYWNGDIVNPATNHYGVSLTTNTKGLVTTSKVGILGGNGWITTITGYDDKGRPIYVSSKNDYLETTDIVESKLDFTGKVLETKTTHKKTGKADIVTIDRFEYDHQDRLIAQTQKINNQISERIVKNNYDELGQLESKLTGNGTQAGYTDVTAGISITDDVIEKTGASGWNEGLATLGSFQADGYVEFEAGTNNKSLMVGLSTSNINASYCSIGYAIFLGDNGIVYIMEACGTIGSFGAYQIGDNYRVERIGNKIYYKKNGEIFYSSTTTSIGTLLGDVSMHYTNGKIKNLHIVDNSKGLQNVDYDYNVRGWLTNINQDAQADNDLFNFTLRYNNPTSGTALYNGNIAQTSWNTTNTDSSTKTYTYSYDALNRIMSGIDNTGNYNLTSVSYDKNGNILNLQRKGHTNAGATTFGVMDNLSYTYDSGNKLTKVVDNGNDTYGFKDGTNSGNDYTYDANGNMTEDKNKGISNISYNHLNLPTKVSFSNNINNFVEYIYDASGVKLEKKVVINGSSSRTYYAGNYIYERPTWNSPLELQFFNHAEGYAKPNGSSFDYVYQYKDHLGNVRLSYADSDNNGTIAQSEIIEESNYYPFGLKHKGYNNVTTSNGNSTAQKRGYQDQMLDDDLGLNWSTFKYRNYDASLARFHNIDPLAEDYYYNSTYSFSENKVIQYSELEGLEATMAQFYSKANKAYQGVKQFFTGAKETVVTNISNKAKTPTATQKDVKQNQIKLDAAKDKMAQGLIMTGIPMAPSEEQVLKAEEYLGDAMVVLSPLTGPFAPSVAALGTVISTAAGVSETVSDLSEGNTEKVVTDAVVDVAVKAVEKVTKIDKATPAVEVIKNIRTMFYTKVVIPKMIEKVKEE